MDHPLLSRVRWLAVGTAAVVTAGYALIALDVVTVVEDQAAADATPLVVAAALFALLAALLAAWPRLPVLLGGIALQALVLVGYVAIAAERAPAFEAWGLGLKALQLALLAALAYLVARRGGSQPATGA